MPRSTPPPLGLVLATLRKRRGWTGRELEAAGGLPARSISLYEVGKRRLTRERLETLVRAMGFGVEEIDSLLLNFDPAAEAPEAAPASPVDPTAEEARQGRQLSSQLGRVAADLAWNHLLKRLRARRARQDRQRAAGLWARLKRVTPGQRLLLVESAQEFQLWALAERLCEESAEAASDRADRALELARLAHRVAELAKEGGDAWRSRLEGYALAFVANAQRVGGTLPVAAETFVRAWKLWNAGTDTGLLGEWRLLDLEGSLLRDQRQFGEALDRADRARAAAPRTSVGRILMKKASALEQMGEAERAIEALQEAAPLIDERREPRLFFALRFNLVTNLLHLDRFEEAAALLPEVQRLALVLRKELDVIRGVWLRGKIEAGLGHGKEARAAFEQVRGEFTTRENAYDCARVTMDLAVLLLERGPAGKVRDLAREMLWIFRSQGLSKEALAALKVFCDAAPGDAATVEMARRVALFLERAQHDPELRFEE
jgi:tetratricopeptide (TPR) repeat protein/transcriptional regulator with XRE-family HTH domain